MEQRQLGKSGLKVSALGLGLMSMSGIYGNANDDESVNAIHYAIDKGMTFLDSADTPYEAKADFLPRTLEEALQHLKVNKALRDGFGNAFIDYYCRIKEAEIARFNLEVSDWEHREYFDLF